MEISTAKKKNWKCDLIDFFPSEAKTAQLYSQIWLGNYYLYNFQENSMTPSWWKVA